jgi:uncharacterized membrane protein YqhA
MSVVERALEGFLWRSRFVVVVAVLASVLVAIGLLFVTTVDVVSLAGGFVKYADPGLSYQDRNDLRTSAVGAIVGIIDGYLLSGVLLIFALGLYELFVGKIDAAENSEFAQRLLLVRSLDELKNRLARVILLILMVKFLQQALKLKFEGPIDLLYLALGIAAVGVALYLSNKDH